jgi:hypothetical protein
MTFIAQDVMDDAAVILNDTAKAVFTYNAQLPFVSRANRYLEKILIENGLPQQRVISAAIPLAANALTLALPSDFLFPDKLYERNQGDTASGWSLMYEQQWEPQTWIPSTWNTYWSFRNGNINFPGANVAKEILLFYERNLAAIIGQNSPEDYAPSRDYLSAKTAEFCARYIGMNGTFADEIRDNEVSISEDALVRVLVLNQQGMVNRRKRFTTKVLGTI